MSNLPLEVVEMFGQTIAKVVPITIVLALVFSVLTHFWACNPGTPWWRKRELVTDICYWFFVPLFARVLRIGLLVLGAGVVFNIHDADELIAFYDNGHGPLSRIAALVAGDAVPGPVGLHAVLAAPHVSRRRILEISRHPSFVGGSGLDFGGALSSGQPVPRNHRGRRHPADGGHLAQHHALGRAVHDLPFGLRPRQSELDARPVQIRAGDAGLPPLASHRARSRAATPISPARFRSGTCCSEPSGCRKTSSRRITASTIRRSRPRSAGNWPIRSGNRLVASTAVYRRPFAVRSPIDVRFASSGAGSAAYRFSRLVNAPG